MKEAPKFRYTYKVGAGNVTLSVLLGEGVQGEKPIGGSVVKLGPEELGRGQIENLTLGKGTNLAGKSVSITSVVFDIDPNHNHTSVTWELKGGPEPARPSLALDTDVDRGAITYHAEVEFIK